MKDPAEDEIEEALPSVDAALRWADAMDHSGAKTLAAALRQSQSRASSLEGRLEAAMKVVEEGKKLRYPGSTSQSEITYDVDRIKKAIKDFAALDETGGRAK